MENQISIFGMNESNEIKKGKKKDKTLGKIVSERIAKYGVETVTQEEIIAVLTDIPLEKIKVLFEEYGVIELAKNVNTLKLTDIQRKKLSMVFELSKQINTAKVVDKPVLDSSSKAGEYMMNFLAYRAVEVFAVVFLNSQNKIIKSTVMFEGTITESSIYAREIVKEAILCNAVSAIIGHNHPGNSQKASSSDISSTNKIKAALEVVSIKLVDHIIVCDNGYKSFAESGLL